MDYSLLKGKYIALDAGHGGTSDPDSEVYDSFRVGPGGVREEVVNLNVTLKLRSLLEAHGARVEMTRGEDVYMSIEDRVEQVRKAMVDVVVSVHHNSIGALDISLNYPAVFIHGSVNKDSASRQLASCLLRSFEDLRKTTGYILSDQLVFRTGFGLLKGLSFSVPAVIGEFSFFNHAEEEKKLVSEDYCQKEAEAYLQALVNYFSIEGMVQPSEAFTFDHQGLRSRLERRLEQEKQKEKHRLKEQGIWEAFYHMGDVELKVSRFESALDYFELSAALFTHSPRFLEVYRGLALCYEKLGEEELAKSASEFVQQGMVLLKDIK